MQRQENLIGMGKQPVPSNFRPVKLFKYVDKKHYDQVV